MNWQATETRRLAVSGSDQVENFESLCTGVYLIADADCFVAFDENADLGSFLIKANIVYPLERVNFTQIHAITSGGTGNLYILATRTSR